MSDLTTRRARPGELAPLSKLLADPADLALVNPSAKRPFDPEEWGETWLGDTGDVGYYVLDAAGAVAGFFALRDGLRPEQRHLAFLYLAPAHRGGGGARMIRLAEEAAREAGARALTLKVALRNLPALRTYRRAGFEPIAESDGIATMRRDLP